MDFAFYNPIALGIYPFLIKSLLYVSKFVPIILLNIINSLLMFFTIYNKILTNDFLSKKHGKNPMKNIQSGEVLI